MGTHLRYESNASDWEDIQSQIDQDNADDPGAFSQLLKSYLHKVKQVRSAYEMFCKRIFPPSNG